MADALAVNDRLIYPIINQYRRLTVTAEASSSRVHRFVFVDSRSIERADRESWRLLVQEAALIAAEARALLEELADRAFLWRGAWDVRERAARGGAAPRRVEVPALERRLAACIRGLMHVRGLLLVLVLLLLVLLQLLLLLRPMWMRALVCPAHPFCCQWHARSQGSFRWHVSRPERARYSSSAPSTLLSLSLSRRAVPSARRTRRICLGRCALSCSRCPSSRRAIRAARTAFSSASCG
mmetsp:Transcript_37342/g.92525  ORF Transcript_37342/g.92525 Transcript_37342/m.92525 type:complete len:239 (-) Transcript_37342:1986-2702(-)